MEPPFLIDQQYQTRDQAPRSVLLTIGLALATLTVVRLAVAAAMPLSPDEAYYWVWSRALATGYLDHPPMVALWIRLGTLAVGQTAMGVRLLAPLSAAVGTVLLLDAGRVLFGRDAGVRAAVLLNATLMLGAGAVTMTPDTPLLFFWTLAVWALARIATGGAGSWWLAVGTAAGLGLDSKYTAALLGLGIALWLLTPAMRHWLWRPWPWAGGALALLLTAPVVAWNAAHGWASFMKQGGRTGDWAPSHAFRYFGELLGGQVGLATPVVFVLFVLGVAAAIRRWRDPRWGLVAALVLPGTIVFVQHALGDRVQANWVAVLYPGAALAAGGVVGRAQLRRWWQGGAWLGAALVALVYIQASWAPLRLPPKLDPTMRLAGFDALAAATDQAAADSHAAFVAAQDYGTASLLAWHGVGVPVLAAARRWRLFDLDQPDLAAAGLLLLRRGRVPDPHLWQSAVEGAGLTRGRNGTTAEDYQLFRVLPRTSLGIDATIRVLPPRR